MQEATKLGGRLSRESLVDAYAKVENWTANKMHSPMSVGSKQTGKCILIAQLNGGTWSKQTPGDYLCGGLIDSGIGG